MNSKLKTTEHEQMEQLLGAIILDKCTKYYCKVTDTIKDFHPSEWQEPVNYLRCEPIGPWKERSSWDPPTKYDMDMDEYNRLYRMDKINVWLRDNQQEILDQFTIEELD